MFCSVFEMGNNKLYHRSRACGLVGSGGGIEQPHMCGGSQRLKITGTLYESSKLQVHWKAQNYRYIRKQSKKGSYFHFEKIFGYC